jgi:hypothetical protein
MPHQPQPSDSDTSKPDERHHRFRTALQQIHAHQPAEVLRHLASDRWSRSRKP